MVISLWLKELSKSSQWFECFTQSLNIVNAVTYSLEIRSYTNNHFFFYQYRAESNLRSIRVFHRPKYKRLFSMDYRERGSHARGVYPSQYTLRMATAGVKQEEETDTRVTRKSIVRNMAERNAGTKRKAQNKA